jgi:hypothetical protein
LTSTETAQLAGKRGGHIIVFISAPLMNKKIQFVSTSAVATRAGSMEITGIRMVVFGAILL